MSREVPESPDENQCPGEKGKNSTPKKDSVPLPVTPSKCPVTNQENMNVTTIKTISHHAPEIAQKVSLADKSQTRWL